MPITMDNYFVFGNGNGLKENNNSNNEALTHTFSHQELRTRASFWQ